MHSLDLLSRIRIVLVNTTHPGNIGAACRAMKNMGLSRLYLVDPKEFPHEKAVWRAGHALDVLDNIVVTETLDEALGDCGLVIGTSARERKIPIPLLNPREAASQALSEAGNHEIAFVFGREDRGLTNEELQKCHMHVHIPTNEEYSSLNLAMAVQVLGYELRMTALGSEAFNLADDQNEADVPPASAKSMTLFYDYFEKILIDIGYIDPEQPRQTMTRVKKMFNRTRLNRMEIDMLHGILKKIERPKKR